MDNETLNQAAYEVLKSRVAILSGQEDIVKACILKYSGEPNHTPESLAYAVQLNHFDCE